MIDENYIFLALSERPSTMSGLTLESFGVSVAVNVIICLAVFFFFGWLRKMASLEKFYAPKRYALEHLDLFLVHPWHLRMLARVR